MIKRIFLPHIDWWIVGSVILLLFSIITMGSFGSPTGYLLKQSIWACVALVVMFLVSRIDISFIKKPWVLLGLFTISNVLPMLQ